MCIFLCLRRIVDRTRADVCSRNRVYYETRVCTHVGARNLEIDVELEDATREGDSYQGKNYLDISEIF